MMKIPGRTASIIVAIFAWVLLSALLVFIIWSMRDRARLIRDNDNERIFSLLFTSLSRGDDNFGSTIETNQVLKERIAGFAIYGSDLLSAYRWGKAPQIFDEAVLTNETVSRFGRYTLPEKRGNSVKFILSAERMLPPRPPEMPEPAVPQAASPALSVAGTVAESESTRRRTNNRQTFSLFSAVAGEKYVYIEISHSAYWRTQTLTTIAFPVFEILFLCIVFYVRHLYLRNREYRERIEAQQNLVVLGTAASTLAHEIKNPLLSIRLQTGILRKIFVADGDTEFSIIEEEVDRISALIYRVNDYLREAAGNQAPVNVYTLLAETALRLCNRDFIGGKSVRDAVVLMDADRLRSVFENITRNALEAGGPEEAVDALIEKRANTVFISILDRGKGISGGEIKRVFDPFFTSKSTGTGIGLSISKRFVEAANGSISLENREGGGAKVTIALPAYPSS
jgi:two-component system sensor histidine kinase HydH